MRKVVVVMLNFCWWVEKNLKRITIMKIMIGVTRPLNRKILKKLEIIQEILGYTEKTIKATAMHQIKRERVGRLFYGQ
jgi:hypothetical protein